jgi:hypothetical protein
MEWISFAKHRFLAALISGLLFIAMPVLSQTSTQNAQELDALRIAYSNFAQANIDYQQLRDSGGLSRTEQADYESWIHQLADRVLRKCRAIEQPERTQLADDVPCAQITSSAITSANIDLISEKTEAEKTALLIEQMNGSMGQFDETLLREQDRIKAQKPRGAYTGGAGGGDMAGENGEGANGVDAHVAQQSTPGDAPSGSKKSAEKQASTGQATNQSKADGGNTQPKTGKRGSPGNTTSTTPDDIPDGRNDDIVARQLREAAENETDPGLREKLWEEYRRYKTGTR